MARQRQLTSPHVPAVLPTALAGEILDPDSLAARAAEVASRQRSPETRRTYATVYRAFVAFTGSPAVADGLTPEAIRGYRDALERAGRSPATIAKHLSALRTLAEALGADHAIRTVRSARVARGTPRALTAEEWERLLQMPDRRTGQGKRDLALLHLLGTAGLRRAEAANLLIGDVDERRRANDARLRKAIPRSTSWWVTVRGSDHKSAESCVTDAKRRSSVEGPLHRRNCARDGGSSALRRRPCGGRRQTALELR